MNALSIELWKCVADQVPPRILLQKSFICKSWEELVTRRYKMTIEKMHNSFGCFTLDKIDKFIWKLPVSRSEHGDSLTWRFDDIKYIDADVVWRKTTRAN